MKTRNKYSRMLIGALAASLCFNINLCIRNHRLNKELNIIGTLLEECYDRVEELSEKKDADYQRNQTNSSPNDLFFDIPESISNGEFFIQSSFSYRRRAPKSYSL